MTTVASTLGKWKNALNWFYVSNCCIDRCVKLTQGWIPVATFAPNWCFLSRFHNKSVLATCRESRSENNLRLTLYYVCRGRRLSSELREMFGWTVLLENNPVQSYFRQHKARFVAALAELGNDKNKVRLGEEKCCRPHISRGHLLGHTAPGSCCFLGAQ